MLAENSPKPAAVLRVENLAADAGPLRLFSGVSFTLNPADALILRGPNGSGKTTLLRIITGLYPRAAGDIIFADKATGGNYNIAENCHFLGHKNGLKAAQTVRENLTFFSKFDGAHHRQNKTNDFTEKVSAAAAALSIEPLLDLPAALLSAGQARRAAFARLLVSARPIWCLDEPTAALDTASQQSVEALCRAHLDGGGYLMASTHLPFLNDVKGRKNLTLTPDMMGQNEANL